MAPFAPASTPPAVRYQRPPMARREVARVMGRIDAAELELTEALERLANAVNAVAYQLERWAERLRATNDIHVPLSRN